MRKVIYVSIICWINFTYLQAQSSSESQKYFNKILPSSPTTSSLMKFEEIPVDNYTGIPNINIPVANVNIENDLNLNIELKYHPASIAVEEKASDVGLGWNLIAGGTITRTVRGLPDEYISNVNNKEKRGIYQKDETNFPNRYNQVQEILKNGNLGFDNLERYDKYNEFAWQAFLKNTYDTEYDLYQYNFFGNIGRFIIKRKENGEFVVKNLDQNNLKIIVTNNSNFEPIGFSITDEKGYIYIFEIIEKSDSNDVVFTSGYGNIGNSSISRTIEYNSAFHLNQIKNTNNVPLVIISFEEPSKEIVIINSGSTYSFFGSSGFLEVIRAKQCEEEVFPYFKPTDISSINQIITYTRKLKEINIIDKSLIKFEFETGREDSNLHNPSQSKVLKKIIINDINSKVSKSYVLQHSYRESIYKRLFLSGINVLARNNIPLFNYELFYKSMPDSEPINVQDTKLGKDYWGYLNKRPKYYFSGYYREVTPSFTDVDVLTKIKLPTSGQIEFNYENNTYSYNSAYENITETLTNWDENINNWDEKEITLEYNKSDKDLGVKKQIFTLQETTKVYFLINNSFGQNNPSDWRYILYKNTSSGQVTIPLVQFTGIEDPDTTDKKIIDLEPGQYTLQFSSVDLNFNKPFTSKINIFYKEKHLREKYQLAAGLRIKDISYKDQNIVSKKLEYNYQDSENNELSSGSLVIPKPIYDYVETSNKKGIRCVIRSYSGIPIDIVDIESPDYYVTTTNNIVPVQTSKGDIGYKYVAVKEDGKGQINSTYTSPIEIPNNYTKSTSPPILYLESPDYKRGLLKNVKKIDINGKTLESTANEYSYNDTIENVGIMYFRTSIPISEYYSLFNNYKDFTDHIRGCGQHSLPAHSNTIRYVGAIEKFYDTTSQCAFYSGEAPGLITFKLKNEIVGKANLITQDESAFFSNQNVIKTLKNIQYNVLNYPIKQTIISPDNTIEETSYSYAHEKGNLLMISKNMVGIPLETETKQTIGTSTKTLSKSETFYPLSQAEADTKTSGLVLPTSVLSYDLQTPTSASTEITYDKYDSKGNLQQYTTKDGISTTVIWGYNQSQPIAKIEGAKLSDISQTLMDSIVNASTNDAQLGTDASEQSLISALDIFRNNSALSNYQISTYTYDSLIGVKSITPPSGIREIYVYDTANRLKEVKQLDKDAAGNPVYKIVKEYKYNYKN
ncbi:hypothetical protein [Chryseobacterium sp. W4I1]|uniref:hypothetical protein n=1 Tax=Chryseobacterium sp. W4I1 TaxID=3042293 RepID=UPI00278407BC|nr:hypothetical protein [Chryseobacterium sp. W4I1]MDQ0781688.1 hypothetical protein [Chryseobacterium sp. W4I1]